jgi:hypothetical protein
MPSRFTPRNAQACALRGRVRGQDPLAAFLLPGNQDEQKAHD